MLSLALAAQLSAPLPNNPVNWFTPNDMPVAVQRGGISRGVITRAVVRPDGSLQACEVEVGSGLPQLDQVTCQLISRRGRFRPARWIDGSPSYGVHRMPVIWAMEPPAPSFPADIELTVQQMPRGVRSPATVIVAFAADATGRPLACTLDKAEWRTTTETHPALAKAACDALTESFKARPARDPSGTAVRSVQTAR
jgi:hypothetical protein